MRRTFKRHAHLPAPILAMDRETLVGWFQRNDPNGCWTDEAARAEGYRPASLTGLRDVLTDGEHGDLVEWILSRVGGQ